MQVESGAAKREELGNSGYLIRFLALQLNLHESTKKHHPMCIDGASEHVIHAFSIWYLSMFVLPALEMYFVIVHLQKSSNLIDMDPPSNFHRSLPR